MKNLRRVSALAILVTLAVAMPAVAERAASLTVPITGSNNFKGTAAINRFVVRGNHIFAIGIVRDSSGTAFAGVEWPVTVTRGGGISTTSGQAPAAGRLTRINWSPNRQDDPKLVQVQASSCGVLHISLGATDVNIAGADVSLAPIGLDISGQSGTPVGDLVCSALNLLGNVAGLVNVLNSLLSTVTGLLGGLTGSLGGLTGGLAGGL